MEYRPHLKISYFSRWQFSRIFRKLYLPKSTDVFTICVSQSDRRLLTPSPHTSVAQTLPQFVSWIGRPLLVVFVSRGRNLIEGAGASKTTVSVLRARKIILVDVVKSRVMIDVSTLSKNGLPVRTFDVCLARPKNWPTDIVCPHAAQLMIDRTGNHFCLFWPSADEPSACLQTSKCQTQCKWAKALVWDNLHWVSWFSTRQAWRLNWS